MSIALAMDAFAVAITLGMNGFTYTIGERLKVGFSFGFFQGIFFFLGVISLKFISNGVTLYNNLIAGVILIVLGIRMLKEAFEEVRETEIEINERNFSSKRLPFKLLIVCGVATSIDALAAGITYGLIYNYFLFATFLISFTAFLLSCIGATFGKKLGHVIGNKANLFGGFMIILLGIKAIFFA